MGTGEFLVVQRMGSRPGEEADLKLMTQSAKYDSVAGTVEMILSVDRDALQAFGQPLRPGAPTSFKIVVDGDNAYIQFPQIEASLWSRLPVGRINAIAGTNALHGDRLATTPLLQMLSRTREAEVIEQRDGSTTYRGAAPARAAMAIMSLGSITRLNRRLTARQIESVFSGNIYFDVTVTDDFVTSATVDLSPLMTAILEEISGQPIGEVAMSYECQLSRLGEPIAIDVPDGDEVVPFKELSRILRSNV